MAHRVAEGQSPPHRAYPPKTAGFQTRATAPWRPCACPKASGLRQVRAVGQVLPFDDEVGYSALLLQGRYPQPHMQGRQGRELCLYRRATGKASVSEADALLKP
ncbi:hypothetical protein [Pseudomonas aeruginosa]